MSLDTELWYITCFFQVIVRREEQKRERSNFLVEYKKYNGKLITEKKKQKSFRPLQVAPYAKEGEKHKELENDTNVHDNAKCPETDTFCCIIIFPPPTF